MPVEFENFGLADIGKTIPYNPNFSAINCADGTVIYRTNVGFIDLRGHPERVVEIVEARASTQMQRILETAAQPDAPFITLGCDLRTNLVESTWYSGGYVEVCRADQQVDPDELVRWLGLIDQHLDAASGELEWSVTGKLQTCVFNHGTADEVLSISLIVGFEVKDAVREAAEASREKLIASLYEALIALPW